MCARYAVPIISWAHAISSSRSNGLPHLALGALHFLCFLASTSADRLVSDTSPRPVSPARLRRLSPYARPRERRSQVPCSMAHIGGLWCCVGTTNTRSGCRSTVWITRSLRWRPDRRCEVLLLWISGTPSGVLAGHRGAARAIAAACGRDSAPVDAPVRRRRPVLSEADLCSRVATQRGTAHVCTFPADAEATRRTELTECTVPIGTTAIRDNAGAVAHLLTCRAGQGRRGGHRLLLLFPLFLFGSGLRDGAGSDAPKAPSRPRLRRRVRCVDRRLARASN